MAPGRAYERRGDPFTLKVMRGEGPPCVIRWVHRGTGRDYFTRVPVHRCQRLDAGQLAQSVREHAAQLTAQSTRGRVYTLAGLLPLMAFDWTLGERTVRGVRREDTPEPGSVRVLTSSTPTGRDGARGARLWMTCPRCERRAGVLYASPWGAYGARGVTAEQYVTGCRVCLGLTDASRQRRGCLD